MQVTRLYLRNYRVYEEPLEIEVPPGLVGIYGPNGAGKSALIESIRWALYGRSRTSNEEIRTSGINADCITEVQFEHESHLYVVRRTITGVNSTVRAQAHADGMQVAEGVKDTTRYVHSVLGMGDTAFRASVYAEQKQLASFSGQAPAERRRLVLQLLGITPLDAARDQARKDARFTREQFERLRDVLPDLEDLSREVTETDAAAVALAKQAAADVDAVTAARVRLEAEAAVFEDLDDRRQEHERLVAEGRSVRSERDQAAARVIRLEEEIAGLQGDAGRLRALSPEAEGLESVESSLRLVAAVTAAQAAMAAVEVPAQAQSPSEEICEGARAGAAEAVAALADWDGQIKAARADHDRATAAAGRSESLDVEADCPLCGQALGDAFAQVQAHRLAEVAAAAARIDELTCGRKVLAEAVATRAAIAAQAALELAEARTTWAEYQGRLERRRNAEQAVENAVGALGRTPEPDEALRLSEEVERRRTARAEMQRIAGRLERQEAAQHELDDERQTLAGADGQLLTLRDKVAALGFQSERLEMARTSLEEARTAADQAVARAHASELSAAQARSRAEGEARRLADAEVQHARLAELGEDARHLGRLGELLHAFRNTMVATVGPRLSIQAAALFSELTDNEYDRLEVDPDTYEIRVRDAGLAYGMSRFSGSETDLANLALRVAISEHVRFQSGGAVGLLVLDEVFGPLDDDRKERMLMALERLRGRFRQVLVVTHDGAIKEQLPHAIEVVKLPGRRATARLVNG